MSFPEHLPHHFTTVERGLVGLLATSTGTAVSLFPAVESWLRITSLVIGIAVGLVTLHSILSNRKK